MPCSVNHGMEALTAMNVAFPLVRHELDTALTRFAPQVKRAAEKISELLGYKGRPAA